LSADVRTPLLLVLLVLLVVLVQLVLLVLLLLQLVLLLLLLLPPQLLLHHSIRICELPRLKGGKLGCCRTEI
jgi:hypothetical protein